MSDQEIIKTITGFLMGNAKELGFGVVLIWFLKIYIPKFINFIIKKTSQTVSNFFAGIEAINKAIEGMSTAIKDINIGLTNLKEVVDSMQKRNQEADERYAETTRKLDNKMDKNDLKYDVRFLEIEHQLAKLTPLVHKVDGVVKTLSGIFIEKLKTEESKEEELK